MGLRTGFRTFNSSKTLLPGKGVPQIGTDEGISFAPFTEAASDTILIRDPTEFADISMVETPEPRSWQTTTNTLSTARARTCRRAREPLQGRWRCCLHLHGTPNPWTVHSAEEMEPVDATRSVGPRSSPTAPTAAPVPRPLRGFHGGAGGRNVIAPHRRCADHPWPPHGQAARCRALIATSPAPPQIGAGAAKSTPNLGGQLTSFMD